MEKTNKYSKLFKVYQRIKKLGVDSKAEAGKFSYDYVSLNKFKSIVDPVLEELKIGYTQPLTIIDGKNCLVTIVYDEETGEEIVKSTVILKPRSETNPQDWGASITYFRRYTLFSIFGIIGDKDDDCFIEESEIKFRVNEAKSVKELQKLYSSIRPNQQEELKDLFSNRKRELLEDMKKENEKIINNTEINEG